MRRLLLIAPVLSACFGAPVAQAPECGAYVACIRAIDSTLGQTTNLIRFEEGGFCWNNETLGRTCHSACVRALERMREREPTLPRECQP